MRIVQPDTRNLQTSTDLKILSDSKRILQISTDLNAVRELSIKADPTHTTSTNTSNANSNQHHNNHHLKHKLQNPTPKPKIQTHPEAAKLSARRST
jgi:hypothetical protein